MPTKENMRNIIDYIEEPKFKSLMLELSKSDSSEGVDAIIKRYNGYQRIMGSLILRSDRIYP